MEPIIAQVAEVGYMCFVAEWMVKKDTELQFGVQDVTST